MTDLTKTDTGTPVYCGTVYATAWIAPAEMSYESWEQQGRTFQAIHQSLAFWLGDWILAGQNQFGEKYTQAIVITNKSIETLEQYVWVCRSIEPARRYPPESGLSYTHHRYVARLPPEEQDYWLALAQRGDNGIPWTSAKLKQELDKRAPFSKPSLPRLSARTTPTSAAQFIRSHFDNQWVAQLIQELNQ